MLSEMYTGRVRFAWDQTASFMALLANCHKGKHSRPARPKDFHPLRDSVRRPRSKEENKANFRLLRDILQKGIKGGGQMKVIKLKAKKPCSPPATN